MFQDDLHSPEQTEELHRGYERMANAVSESLKSYLWVLGHVNERFKNTGKDIHVAASLLLMEYADPIDGVSILARKGSARNCVPIIRTGFELQLNLMYMLQKDETFEDRCLAYEFFHWQKQLNITTKCDPNSSAGKQVRSQTKGELLSDAFDYPDRDIPGEIAALQQLVDHPRYAVVKAEYERSKVKRWYGMWNGPRDLERLAAELDRQGHYETMYRYWSGHAHGENAMKRMHEEEPVMQAVRCPMGLPDVCRHACNLANEMAGFLVLRFVPHLQPELGARYLANIKPGMGFINSVKGLDG